VGSEELAQIRAELAAVNERIALVEAVLLDVVTRKVDRPMPHLLTDEERADRDLATLRIVALQRLMEARGQ